LDKYLVSECGEFSVLQGHGFLTVYNGNELSYKISQLRRNTEYKFRVRPLSLTSLYVGFATLYVQHYINITFMLTAFDQVLVLGN